MLTQGQCVRIWIKQGQKVQHEKITQAAENPCQLIHLIQRVIHDLTHVTD